MALKVQLLIYLWKMTLKYIFVCSFLKTSPLSVCLYLKTWISSSPHPTPDRRWNLSNRNNFNQDIFGPESLFADACVVSPLRGLQTPHQQLDIADLLGECQLHLSTWIKHRLLLLFLLCCFYFNFTYQPHCPFPFLLFPPCLSTGLKASRISLLWLCSYPVLSLTLYFPNCSRLLMSPTTSSSLLSWQKRSHLWPPCFSSVPQRNELSIAAQGRRFIAQKSVRRCVTFRLKMQLVSLAFTTPSSLSTSPSPVLCYGMLSLPLLR